MLIPPNAVFKKSRVSFSSFFFFFLHFSPVVFKSILISFRIAQKNVKRVAQHFFFLAFSSIVMNKISGALSLGVGRR